MRKKKTMAFSERLDSDGHYLRYAHMPTMMRATITSSTMMTTTAIATTAATHSKYHFDELGIILALVDSMASRHFVP